MYSIFLICNTISFTASLCVTFLLISGFPLRNKLCMGLLTFSMCITLTFLAFAYIYAFILLIPDQPSFYDNYRSEPIFILPNYVHPTKLCSVKFDGCGWYRSDSHNALSHLDGSQDMKVHLIHAKTLIIKLDN